MMDQPHVEAPTTRAVRELVRTAVLRTPAVVGSVRWTLDERDLALVVAARPDDSAWVQLGATVEAIAVALATIGTGVTLGPLDEPRRIALAVTRSPITSNTDRLASCLERSAATLKVPPLRVAAHVPARLAAAAATHASVLCWIETPPAFAELSELVGLASGDAIRPAGACALGVVQTPSDELDTLVRGGRAACRVWLEAVSLGLGVLPVAPISWRSCEGRPEAISIMRRYRALVPSEDAARDVAMLWFGFAA